MGLSSLLKLQLFSCTAGGVICPSDESALVGFVPCVWDIPVRGIYPVVSSVPLYLWDRNRMLRFGAQHYFPSVPSRDARFFSSFWSVVFLDLLR